MNQKQKRERKRGKKIVSKKTPCDAYSGNLKRVNGKSISNWRKIDKDTTREKIETVSQQIYGYIRFSKSLVANWLQGIVSLLSFCSQKTKRKTDHSLLSIVVWFLFIFSCVRVAFSVQVKRPPSLQIVRPRFCSSFPLSISNFFLCCLPN